MDTTQCITYYEIHVSARCGQVIGVVIVNCTVIIAGLVEQIRQLLD